MRGGQQGTLGEADSDGLEVYIYIHIVKMSCVLGCCDASDVIDGESGVVFYQGWEFMSMRGRRGQRDAKSGGNF